MATLARRENVAGVALPVLLLLGLAGVAVATGVVRLPDPPADMRPDTVTLSAAPFPHRPAGD